MTFSIAIRRAAPTARLGIRAFSTTPGAQKTVTETVKEKAQDLNLKAGKTLAAGIETAEGAAKATKEAVGMGAKDAKKKAEQTAEVGQQKANQASAEARGKAEDLREMGKKSLD
ncbi:hypothetical protein FS749_001033 [Ceratobasidium sp. UAMH 11750]|nr:hypothetical protein FS749_001033 [Ceratobasidium sp. UAMH 11750]